MNNIIKEYMQSVVQEFKGVPIEKAAVHTSTTLPVLMDLLLEHGMLVSCRGRRQGQRGRNSARNHMLRKALWFARQTLRTTNKPEVKRQDVYPRRRALPWQSWLL